MKKVNFVFLCMVAVSIVSALFFIEKNNHFLLSLEKKLETFFSRSFLCKAHLSLIDISLLRPCLNAQQVLVSAPDNNSTAWFWAVKNITVYSSWYTSIMQKVVPLRLSFNDVDVFSSVEHGSFAIAPHIKKLFFDTAEAPPVTLEKLLLKNARLCFVDVGQQWQLKTNGAATLMMGKGQCIGDITLTDLNMSDKNNHYFFNNGSLNISLFTNQAKQVEGIIDGLLSLVYVYREPVAMIKGSFDKKNLKVCFSLRDHASEKIDISWLFDDKKIIIDGFFNAIHLKNFLRDLPIEGMVRVKGDIDYRNNVKAHIDIEADTLAIGDLLVKNIHMGCSIKNERTIIIEGSCSINAFGAITFSGTLDNNGDGTLVFRQSEKAVISVGDKPITCKQGIGTFVMKHYCLEHIEGKITGAYQNKEIPIHGVVTKKNEPGLYAFKVGAKNVTAKGTIKNNILDQIVVLFDKEELCNAQHVPHGHQATVSLTCLNTILNRYGISLPMHGIVQCELPHDEKKPYVFEVKKGNVYIPIHNFIEKMEGFMRWDYKKRVVEIPHATLIFHNGSITLESWKLSYNKGLEIIGKIMSKDLLISHQQLICYLNGGFIYTKHHGEKSKLVGALSIDNAQYKKNIFAEILRYAVQRRSLPHGMAYFKLPFECDLDISVFNQTPINISTSFIDVQMSTDIRVSESTKRPRVEGSVYLVDGVLKFPACPLYLTHGVISFNPPFVNDPHIDFMAKNTFKKHTVVLRASGTLSKPEVSFESTPSLTKQQIITLLLAGSENGSLLLVMPTLLSQHIQQLLFGISDKPGPFDTFLKGVLRPLQNMRITPSFFDQTSRGGFRGSLEVDVSERFRAVLKKNFSLSEDSRFEVEYAVSDDISMRGIKDERGDLSGEVEVRFKW